MVINIGGVAFEGPYDLGNTSFAQVPGVYLVSDLVGSWIDMGETDELSDRLANHERKDCWRRNAHNRINIWFHYERSKQIRLSLERRIRGAHSFSCGDR